MSNNKNISQYKEPLPEGFFDWSVLTVQYLSSADILAKQLRKQNLELTVPLFLFRHALELALKTYSILFNIPIKKNHDVREIGKQISKLLSNLDTTTIEDADELIELPTNNLEISSLPKGLVFYLTLQHWDDELPKIVEKYLQHSYIKGEIHLDPNNTLLRYPENKAFLKKLNQIQDDDFEIILADINDQLMLLSLVISIKMSQPLENTGIWPTN